MTREEAIAAGKEVLREAMNRGYYIILLRENGFPKLYKPVGEAFYACAEGLLLQISPWEFHMEKKVITRAQCLQLNAMAERMAGLGRGDFVNGRRRQWPDR